MAEQRTSRVGIAYLLQYPDVSRAAMLGKAGNLLYSAGETSAGVFGAAERVMLREAIRYAAMVAMLESPDGEGDRFTDEQAVVATALARNEPPLPIGLEDLLDALREDLRALLRERVLRTVVDDDRHEPTPWVGPVAGVTAPAVGAPGADTPGADVPTVGVPTDGLAEASPSAPAVSVEASGAAGAGAPPAAPERSSEWGQAAQQARNYARAWEAASGPLGGPGWLERRPRWLVLLCINLIAAAAGLGILWLVTR